MLVRGVPGTISTTVTVSFDKIHNTIIIELKFVPIIDVWVWPMSELFQGSAICTMQYIWPIYNTTRSNTLDQRLSYDLLLPYAFMYYQFSSHSLWYQGPRCLMSPERPLNLITHSLFDINSPCNWCWIVYDLGPSVLAHVHLMVPISHWSYTSECFDTFDELH